MTIVLRQHRYGKDAIRFVKVERRSGDHLLRDLCVSVSLEGGFDAAYTSGDNSSVLPTDTQKNTVYAFAKEHGIGEIEEFALRLARHFVQSHAPATRARVAVDEYRWERLGPHSFQRAGETRSAEVTYTDGATEVVCGLRDLRLLNTTGSEFAGFARDRYTTLPEAHDRILATAVHARWGHAGLDADWGISYAETRRHLVAAFVDTYSPSVQHTLFAMGRRVLDNRPEIGWVWLSLPNLHHIPADLTPFGIMNDNEVFAVADGPYGHIEATVSRQAAEDRGGTRTSDASANSVVGEEHCARP